MKTLFKNGKVYIGKGEIVTSFIVEDNRFACVGNDLSDCDCEVVDLNGKFVSPGFNDSHMHVVNYGQYLKCIRLADHTSSLADLLNESKKFLKENPLREGNWLMGRGWNQDYFEDVKRMPNRYDLDEVTTEYPFCIIRCCGHALVVNSKALELLEIDDQTPSPDGGTIGKENGVLDGRFYDRAMDYVYDMIPLPTKDDLKDMIETSCKALNSVGVTSAQSDDYSEFRQIDFRIFNQAFKELEEEGKLTVRINEQSNFETLEVLKDFVESGHKTNVGDHFFKIGPLKMLGDGSLGARTAYLSKPYNDDPSTYGLPVFTYEQFEEMITYANDNDMSVAIHAIGDRCLDDVLKAIEHALKENPRTDHRHGIVHCQITRADQLQKIIDLKLHVYAQTIFLDYDINIVKDRVGEELACTSYSWKTLLDNGVSVSNGTDCPVEMPKPLKGIQCAVTRKTLDGVGPYLKDQAFSVAQALDAYTYTGAYASFEENEKGLIKEGYLADFVILDKSPFEVEESLIKDIDILATYVDGRVVFSR